MLNCYDEKSCLPFGVQLAGALCMLESYQSNTLRAQENLSEKETEVLEQFKSFDRFEKMLALKGLKRQLLVCNA